MGGMSPYQVGPLTQLQENVYAPEVQRLFDDIRRASPEVQRAFMERALAQ